jgi:phosphatidate cytidylyltransferase
LDLGLAGWQQAVIGATVGTISQAGDLLESWLKRLSNAKDAGSIIPGHGGILDRMDSILLALPAVYYLLGTVFEP